jgi:hypothetical protein
MRQNAPSLHPAKPHCLKDLSKQARFYFILYQHDWASKELLDLMDKGLTSNFTNTLFFMPLEQSIKR